MTTDRIILGIDPGTNILGYGLIHDKGNRLELINMGVLHLEKLKDQPSKLKKIFETVSEIVIKERPDELAIESQFFGKNVQSMLKLGRAQGVAIAAALHKDIPIFEYTPTRIKQSITGRGNASKEQVSAMLIRMLNIIEAPKYFDATDALAVAVCHYFQRNSIKSDKPYSGWSTFLSANPNRIVRK